MAVQRKGMFIVLYCLAIMGVLSSGGCGRKLSQQDLHSAQVAALREHKQSPFAVMPDWYRDGLTVKVEKVDGGPFSDDAVSVSVNSLHMNSALLVFAGMLFLLALFGATAERGKFFLGMLSMGALALMILAFVLWLGVKLLWSSGHYLPWHFALTLSAGVLISVALVFCGILLIAAASGPGRGHPALESLEGPAPTSAFVMTSPSPSPPPTFELSADDVAKSIRPYRRELIVRVKREVESSLRNMSPAQSLTFVLMRNGDVVKKVPPGPNAVFVKVLIAFCQGKSFEGHDIDSAVTSYTLEAINRAVQEFYLSDEVGSTIAGSISAQVEASGLVAHHIRVITQENADWLKREANTMLHQETAHSIAGQAIDATATSLHHAMHSAGGEVVAAILAKVVATTGGKVLLMQVLKGAVAKVMASAAAKTMIMGFIKKVGVAILIKTAIGKLLLAALAAIGFANIPIFYILLPAIGLFLSYEYKHFPGKLAAKLPDEVESVMNQEFEPLNRSIADTIVERVMSSAIEELTRVRTD